MAGHRTHAYIDTSLFLFQNQQFSYRLAAKNRFEPDWTKLFIQFKSNITPSCPGPFLFSRKYTNSPPRFLLVPSKIELRPPRQPAPRSSRRKDYNSIFETVGIRFDGIIIILLRSQN